MLKTEYISSNKIFNLTAKELISYDASRSSENFKKIFDAFIQGLISFPIELPGTAYHKCPEERKKLMKMLKTMLAERTSAPKKRYGYFFDYMVDELKKERTMLTEAIALDLVLVLIFASFKTSLALTLAVKFLAVKFLTDHPLEEHEAILRKRENPESGIT